MKKLLEGLELKNYALKLGINIEGTQSPVSISRSRNNAPDHEIQKRVIEAERSLRESKLWLIALVSAGASLLSAAVAIIAVCLK